MEAFNYQFTALRGMQAGREYYVVMCPLKLIPKIFLFDEEEIPAELRAQRTLNRARVPDIAKYLVNNPRSYVFSSITASIDGEVIFEPLEENGAGRNTGTLIVPMNAQFLINDGQHRRAAIEEALNENPEIGDDTISVVFFIDAGLKRSQQLFADLNKHAIRPTKSISILYDHRDPMARLAVDLMKTVPIFKGRTETEKTTISNRSTKLFTLSAIYQANQALLSKKKRSKVSKDEYQLARDYWTQLGEIILEWRQIIKGNVSAAELRRSFVHSHGVALSAFGILGSTLVSEYPDSWEKKLPKFAKIDWHRTNTELWEGRAIRQGRMSKARKSIKLTVNALKMAFEIPLTEEELDLEEWLKTYEREV